LWAVQVELSGSVSSQYLTALLMAAPLATGEAGVDIRITDELVSQPYVDMTVRLMERFGVKVGASRCFSRRRQFCQQSAAASNRP
jgi:5-enolpyruvylshikimate-3-phosphate synthase